MAMTRLARTSEVPEGGMITKEHDGAQVLLAKLEGKIYAMNDVCTHQGAPLHDGILGEEGRPPYSLTCPWHEAHYDIRTGRVYQDTPWADDTEVYEVEIRGDDVYVDFQIQAEKFAGH